MANNAQRIEFLIAQRDGFTRTRLPALYSDFRGLKSTNPEGYAANVAAWRRGLAALVRSGLLPSSSSPGSGPSSGKKTAATASATTNVFVLTAGQQLLDVLQSDRYGRPLALDAVIREATQDRELIPLPAFFRAKESIYSRRSWTSLVTLPFQAISWGLCQLGVLDGAAGGEGSSGGRSAVIPLGPAADKMASEQFVVVANVAAAAAAFADKTADLRTRFERTWSVAHFKRVFGQPGAVLDGDDGPRLSSTDLDVLLAFLSRDKGLVVYDGQVVRLVGSDSNDGGGSIADEDRAVAQVRELMDSLTHQTAVLSRRIDDLAAAARDAAVVRKNRVAALAALRQKRQAEAALATRFATLAQLEAVAGQIEQAADHVQVVHALAASADALQSLNAQTGGVERVEDTVDRLRDQMDAADEIGRILADAGPASASAVAAGTPGLVIDEGEIDDELAALEQQERDRTGAVEAAAAAAAASAAAAEAQKAKQKQEAADALAAEETRRRLEAVGSVPDAVRAEAAAEAALEAETTASLGKLSLQEVA